MAAHNYDGDMLTDEVAQVHRSPGFITSNLIGKAADGTMIKEYEVEELLSGPLLRRKPAQGPMAAHLLNYCAMVCEMPKTTSIHECPLQSLQACLARADVHPPVQHRMRHKSDPSQQIATKKEEKRAKLE